MDSAVQFACALDGSGGAETMTPEQASTPDAAGRLVWLHLNYEHPDTSQWLRTRSGISTLAINALLDEDSRPRSVEFPDGLLIILRGVNFNEGSEPEDMVSVRIWLQPNRIVTARRRRVLSPRQLYGDLLEGNGPKNAGDFVVQLAERLDSHIAPVIDSIEDEIEAAEIRYSGQSDARYSGEFGGLRRRTAHLRRYMAPQRDALERLSRLNAVFFDDHQRNRLREEADSVTRQLEDLDLARERAMVAQEELLNKMAQEQNSRMYVLSIVAAIFLPLSFLTGLMGMNVAGLPGTEDPAAFIMLVVMMTGVAVGIVLYFRWRKWL